MGPLDAGGDKTGLLGRMGYSGREVGQFLNMRSYSAIRRPARFALNAMNCFKSGFS